VARRGPATLGYRLSCKRKENRKRKEKRHWVRYSGLLANLDEAEAMS
jgi:hypothetical protein